MGNYWSQIDINEDFVFIDPHTGYKPWVRFEYNKAVIERFNKPKTLKGR